MNILYVVLTYERPNIATACVNSLINNSVIKPDEIVFIDDGSNNEMQEALFASYSQLKKTSIKTSLYLQGTNFGVANSFETAWEITKIKNPDIVFFVESDYIFRRGWMEDVIHVYNNARNTIAMSPVSHPDMYIRKKTHGEFVKLMEDQFGRDVEARKHMYIPFNLNGIEVQGVSNTCGCRIIFWKRLNNVIDSLGCRTEFQHWIDRAHHKWGNLDRKTASDAHMSGSITWYWEQWAKAKNIDISKEFAWLDVCDYSLSEHICGGATSINGKIVPEGSTFVCSPKWKQEYLDKNPRKL